MVKILRHSGASIAVLKLAAKFRCHGCDATVAPKAVRMAAGIEIPEALEVMATDGLEWLHPFHHEKYLMTLNLDEGSGLTRVTNHGHERDRSMNRTAEEVLATWDCWCDHFSQPKFLRMDSEGCHRGGNIQEWGSRRGLLLWVAPGEAQRKTIADGARIDRVPSFSKSWFDFNFQVPCPEQGPCPSGNFDFDFLFNFNVRGRYRKD